MKYHKISGNKLYRINYNNDDNNNIQTLRQPQFGRLGLPAYIFNSFNCESDVAYARKNSAVLLDMFVASVWLVLFWTDRQSTFYY